MALNEFVQGYGFVNRAVGGFIDYNAADNPFVSVSNVYAWNLMTDDGRLFQEDTFLNGKNITRRQVWNNYPNPPAPWTDWDRELRLNSYRLFKLPVPELNQGTVIADASHLMYSDPGDGGSGTGNATIGTGGSKVIHPEIPGGYEEEEPLIASVSVILLFMLAVAAFCFVRGSDEADSIDEK